MLEWGPGTELLLGMEFGASGIVVEIGRNFVAIKIHPFRLFSAT